MYQILLVIQIIGIFVIFAECAFVFVKWETKLQGLLFFASIATLINNVGYYFQMTARSESDAWNGLRMAYIGKAWIPLALFMFSMSLCNHSLNKGIVTVLGVFHSIVPGLVFAGRWTKLFYSDVYFEPSGMFPHLVKQSGIVYRMYRTLMIIYIIVGVSLLIRTILKEKNEIVKKRLKLFLISLLVQVLSFGLYTLFNMKQYDITVLGYTIGAIIMFIAIHRYDLMDTLELGRDYVIDDIAEAIIIVNQNAQIEYMNKLAQSLWKKKELDESMISGFDDLFASDRPLVKNDKYYSINRRSLTHKGIDQGCAYVFTDDTEHYNYMAELKAQMDIAEQARNEAEEANASKSRLLSVVSHELRTPMNAVVSMAEILLREPENLTDKQLRYLQNMRTSGNSLVMIVNDILDKSKIEAGKMEIIEEPYELMPMLSDVKMIIENRIGSKHIDLQFVVKEDVPKVLIGDSLRIRQILINLLNNAVKFTEEGFIRLEIVVEKEEEGKALMMFSISDSGQGILPEDLSRLGEEFAQVDTKKNHQKEGTGLGLSISRDFIAMMGGVLKVESEYGKGSVFYFSIFQGIPVSEEDATQDTLVKRAWKGEEEFTVPQGKLLIVDDTEINLMVMEELLSPLGMQIDTVSSGAEALERVRQTAYDVIFMDYMMPFMDGVETTKQIRMLSETEKDRFTTVPIICLSGDSSDATRKLGTEAGMNDFTVKPVDMKHIKKLLLNYIPSEKINFES